MNYIYKSLIILIIPILFIWGCSKPTENNNKKNINFLESTPPDDLSLKISYNYDTDQSFPAPTIDFAIPTASRVYLEVMNVTGYTVKVLADDYFEAGNHSVEWDVTNEDGEMVKMGIYIIYLKAGNYVDWDVKFLCFEDCDKYRD